MFRDLDKFVSGQKRTFLHLAAKEADVPLAYECIRIGAAVNFRDKDGGSALLLACRCLRATKDIQDYLKTNPLPKAPSRTIATARDLRDREALSEDVLAARAAQRDAACRAARRRERVRQG